MTTDRAAYVADEALHLIAEDRKVSMPSRIASEAGYLRATHATAGLRWTLAEMPPHQLEPVAEYLAGVLNREPMRSGPMYEPHRIALGLFLLALRDLAHEPDQAPDPTLVPAWYADSVAALDILPEEPPDAPATDPIDETDDAYALL